MYGLALRNLTTLFTLSDYSALPWILYVARGFGLFFSTSKRLEWREPSVSCGICGRAWWILETNSKFLKMQCHTADLAQGGRFEPFFAG